MDNSKLRNIIKESLENLMLEDKREVIKKRIKLPDFVAEWAHEMGGKKYAIWIANDFKDFLAGYLLRIMPQEVIRDAAVSMMEQGKISGGLVRLIRNAMSEREGQYNYVMDWLEGRGRGDNPETDNINLRQMSLEDALARSEAWHNRLAQIAGGRIEDEDGEVILTFPDGYYWVDLGKRVCDKEGEAMGHCGSGKGILYSLRKDGRPSVTADVMRDGTVKQMRGRANTKPNPKYHKYIVEFIKSPYVNNFNYWDYRINDNFLMTDLTRDKAYELFNEKPSLIKNQDVRRLMRFFGDELFRDIYHLNTNYFDRFFENNGIDYVG
jgi:hypothetical protein